MTKLIWSRWPNFSRGEFVCRCGCGRADMDEGFMDALQHLRVRYGKPMIISSGFRCPAHNARVSPATGLTGPHTTGRAVDVRVTGLEAYDMLVLAAPWGFDGIGIKQHGPMEGRFLHFDTIKKGPRPRVWSYA